MRLAPFTATLMLFAFPALAQDCPQVGAEAPLTLHQEWIMEGWERREGDPDFVFKEKMARWYDLQNPEGVYFDNFAPGDTQLFHDGTVYGANWEGLQNAARSILHGLTDDGNALVSGDVATTTQGFVGMIDRPDGEIIAFDARSQLGWTCVEGAWKIRQELNYAWIVGPETIAAFFEDEGGSE